MPARITTNTPQAEIYGYEILIGFGTGAYAQAGYAVIQAFIDPSEMAYGISFMMLGKFTNNLVCQHICLAKLTMAQILPQFLAQTGGIALGLSLAGAVFINQAVDGLTGVLPGVPRSELQLAVSGTSGTYFQSLPEDLQDQAVDTIVGSLARVFILVYVGCAVTLVLSLLFTVSCHVVPLLQDLCSV